MSNFDVSLLPGARLVLESVSAEASLSINTTEVQLVIEVSPAEAPSVIVSAPAPVDIIEVLLGSASAPTPVTYVQRVDEVAEDLFYRGEAAPGADEAAPVWHICRISVDAAGAPVLAWAHDGAFTCAWTDRKTYTYE